MVGEQYSRRAFLRTAATAPILAATAATASAQETTTHTVELTDNLVFVPDQLTIAPGDTVVWENVGTVGHSVTAYEDELPADATYWASGGFASESAARSGYPQGELAGGETYEHTFETEGTYGYFCIPHETVGMVGQLSVQPGGAPAPEPVPAPVPQGAVVIAIATTVVLVFVLGFALFLLKYGGDYEGDEKGFARP